MPPSFLKVFDAFEFPKNGRFEECCPRVLSEESRSMGPKLVNSGRMVAIEAAMIPRFISRL